MLAIDNQPFVSSDVADVNAVTGLQVGPVTLEQRLSTTDREVCRPDDRSQDA